MKTAVCTVVAGILIFAGGCAGPRDYLERGNRAFASGNFAEASLNYQKAIQKDPQFAEAFHRLANSQFRQGQMNQALASFERALQLKPGDDALRAEFADAALMSYLLDPSRPKRLYDQVTKLSQEMLAKNPNSYDGLRFAGSLAYSDGRLAEAISVFRKANAIKPMEPDIILPLADALRKSGQLAEGENLATALIQGKHKDFGAIYDWLYAVYRETNRPAQAEAILLSKVANNPKNGAYVIQLAGHYYRVKKIAEMRAALDTLLKRPLDFPNRYLLIGDFYVSIQNWDEAIRWFQTGAKADPKQSLIYRRRVVTAYVAAKKRTEALAELNQILKEQPNALDVRAERAQILVDGGNQQEMAQAITECKALIEKQPGDPRLKFLLGRAYQASGDKNTAATYYAQAAAQRQNYIEPRVALALLDREKQDFKETARLAEEILSIDPNNFQGRLLRASAATALGNLDVAQHELTLLSRAFPNSSEVQLEIGLNTMARKQYSAAEQIFRTLYHSGQDDTRALAALVSTLNAEKQYDRALQLLTGELNRSPNSLAVRELFAVTALMAGKTDLALQQYQRLVELAPRNSEYLVRLADVFRQKGDYQNELAALQQANKLAPKDAVIGGRLAIAQDFSGNRKAAAEETAKALQEAPSDPALLNNRAWFIAEDGGNLDEALAYAQAAVRKLPDNPAVQDTLAWIYTKRKNNDSAIQILDKLVRANPDVAAFHLHLATALYQKKEAAKARAELQTALAKNPSPAEERQIRELLGQIR